MNAPQEDNEETNWLYPPDADTLRDLPIQTLDESEADFVEEIKSGIKAADPSCHKEPRDY